MRNRVVAEFIVAIRFPMNITFIPDASNVNLSLNTYNLLVRATAVRPTFTKTNQVKLQHQKPIYPRVDRSALPVTECIVNIRSVPSEYIELNYTHFVLKWCTNRNHIHDIHSILSYSDPNAFLPMLHWIVVVNRRQSENCTLANQIIG